MEEIKIGQVTHYFSRAGVAAIKILEGTLAMGDTIHILGKTTDFQQKVESMQIEHQPIQIARAGDDVGIKVNSPVKEHDIVYKVTS